MEERSGRRECLYCRLGFNVVFFHRSFFLFFLLGFGLIRFLVTDMFYDFFSSFSTLEWS